MEQLISDIEAFCAKRGISPQKLLKGAINASGTLWAKWKRGDASPTVKVADRLRAFMAEEGDLDHPPAHGDAKPSPQGEGRQ